MLKLGLWAGTPSFVAFVASSYSMLLENFVFFSVLAVLAMWVAIAPRVTQPRGK
jgi:hypothetical protein